MDKTWSRLLLLLPWKPSKTFHQWKDEWKKVREKGKEESLKGKKGDEDKRKGEEEERVERKKGEGGSGKTKE